MALGTRTVNISLRFATPQLAAKTVRFIPDLTAADLQVLLERYYDVNLSTGIGTTTLSGTIALPVQTSGTIAYRVEFPVSNGKNSHYVYLESGSPIDLSELLETVV
jgi:hypothetical protein